MDSFSPSEEESLDNLKEALKENKNCYLSSDYQDRTVKVALSYVKKYYNPGEWELVDHNILVRNVKSHIGLRKSLNKCAAKPLKIVILKDFDSMLLMTTSHLFKGGQISLDVWRNFFDTAHFKLIIITTRESSVELVNKKAWYVHIDTTEEDRRWYLSELMRESKDSRDAKDKQDQIDEAIKWCKTSTLNVIEMAATQANRIGDPELSWAENFKNCVGVSYSSALNVKDSVKKPSFETDMVGLDDVMNMLEEEVIIPIKSGNSLIPICKGIVLYGPPGTGKSTMGRWLSYRLEDRIYLAEESPNEALIYSFKRLFARACKNSPSVVFVDDFESLVKSEENVREILVMLDGINTKARTSVCVIVTCMNINSVPEALLRGGRLEKCKEFKRPTTEQLRLIIDNRLKRTIEGLKDQTEICEGKTASMVANLLEKQLSSNFSNQIGPIINAWSPSNIQFLIDTLIRKAVCHVVRGEEDDSFNPVEIFRQEAESMKSNLGKSTRLIYHDENHTSSYFV